MFASRYYLWRNIIATDGKHLSQTIKNNMCTIQYGLFQTKKEYKLRQKQRKSPVRSEWDLLCTKTRWARFSSEYLLSLSNYHSADTSSVVRWIDRAGNVAVIAGNYSGYGVPLGAETAQSVKYYGLGCQGSIPGKCRDFIAAMARPAATRSSPSFQFFGRNSFRVYSGRREAYSLLISYKHGDKTWILTSTSSRHGAEARAEFTFTFHFYAVT